MAKKGKRLSLKERDELSRKRSRTRSLREDNIPVARKAAEVYISDALAAIREYQDTDPSERDPDTLIGELNWVEEELDEIAFGGLTEFSWDGYWEAVEAFSFLANRLDVEWASPYSYCPQNLEIYRDDLETVSRVAKICHVKVAEVVKTMVDRLEKEYAEQLEAMREREKKRKKRGSPAKKPANANRKGSHSDRKQGK